MSKTVDLGPVSAYALAVKYGYEGTEEEWVTEMESMRLEAVTAASAAEGAASAAEQSQSASSSSAESASESAEFSRQSAAAASESATIAESYAHGGTGAREGEDTDNAKYYMEQAKSVSAVDVATTEKAGIVKPDGTTITVDPDGTLHGSSEVDVMTAEKAGIGRPDGDTITVDEKGVFKAEVNKGLLDKLGESEDGNLTFDGKEVKGGGYIVFPEFTMDFSTGHLSATGGAGVNFSINAAGHLESEVL